MDLRLMVEDCSPKITKLRKRFVCNHNKDNNKKDNQDKDNQKKSAHFERLSCAGKLLITHMVLNDDRNSLLVNWRIVLVGAFHSCKPTFIFL